MILNAERVRVLSWNVHSCIGRTGRFDPDSILRTVRCLRPDLVALQEIDARRTVSGGVDTFKFITEHLDGYAAAARTIRTPEGDYGHLLVTRWPLARVDTLDLSVPGREPRAAIVASIAEPDLQVVAVHLGLGALERRHQLKTIRGAVDGAQQPCIVLGDFNEWRRHGMPARTLCPPFVPATTLATYPARRPIFPLDRI